MLALSHELDHKLNQDYELAAAFVLAAAAFVAYQFCSILVLARTHPTTHAVINALKRSVVVLAGALLAGEGVPSGSYATGAAVALLGCLGYALSKQAVKHPHNPSPPPSVGEASSAASILPRASGSSAEGEAHGDVTGLGHSACRVALLGMLAVAALASLSITKTPSSSSAAAGGGGWELAAQPPIMGSAFALPSVELRTRATTKHHEEPSASPSVAPPRRGRENSSVMSLHRLARPKKAAKKMARKRPVRASKHPRRVIYGGAHQSE